MFSKHMSTAVIAENIVWIVSGFNDHKKPSVIDITHTLPENRKWGLDFCRSPCMNELTVELSEEESEHLLY